MSHKNSSQTGTPAPQTRLFPFTKQEERAIRRAMADAAAYMESFGKGHRPDMIDISHYENYRTPRFRK